MRLELSEASSISNSATNELEGFIQRTLNPSPKIEARASASSLTSSPTASIAKTRSLR